MKNPAAGLYLKIVAVIILTAPGASYSADQRSAVLDEADKQIASSLSFDPQAVAIARSAGRAPFKVATINDRFWLSQPQSSLAEINGWDIPAKANLIEQSKKYPELKGAIEKFLASYDDEDKKFLGSHKAPFDLAAIKANADDLTGILFQIDDANFEQAIWRLKQKFQPLGYDAFCPLQRQQRRKIYGPAEQKSFWQKHGVASGDPAQSNWAIAIKSDPHETIITSQESSRELHFDPSKAESGENRFWAVAGEQIKKLSPSRWQMFEPAHVEVSGKVGIGLLTKAVPPQKYIQVAGTCGPNADVSNEDLCARVKEWHTAHGVDILSTSADSVTLRLRKIPDDLSHFCTQLWLFDTDAFEMPQESGPVRAAALRAYAAGLRHTHIINLWWD